jgi:general secretion pathway protein J
MTRARGFTLIEVIVATSLLALGLALAFASLRGAGQATVRAEQSAERQERLRAVQGFLRTQLTAAMPIPFEFDPDTGQANFLRVSPTRLEYVSSMPGYLSRGGPYLQTLELVPGPRGQTLVFQHQLLGAEGPLKPEREPLVLLEGIAEARFEIRNVDQNARPMSWESQWAVSSQLPPLLRLRLRFSDPARQWPDFVVAPRLAVAYAAGADPMGGRPPEP